MFNNFSPENPAFFFLDNIKKCDRARQATDDNIIQRMRFACRITKSINTHSEYVMRLALSLQQWSRERVLVLRL